jgi:hypothetical protein
MRLAISRSRRVSGGPACVQVCGFGLSGQWTPQAGQQRQDHARYVRLNRHLQLGPVSVSLVENHAQGRVALNQGALEGASIGDIRGERKAGELAADVTWRKGQYHGLRRVAHRYLHVKPL